MDAAREMQGLDNVSSGSWIRPLLIAVVSVAMVAAGLQQASAQPVDPTGNGIGQPIVKSNGQRMLDSPFGTSLRQRELQALAANGQRKLPSTNESIIWSEGDTQFVIECRFLLAEEEFVSGLFEMIDTSNFESTATGVTQGLSLLQNDYTPDQIPNNVSLSASVRNLPASWGAITAGQHDAIFQAVKGDIRASISQAPTITMFNGQSGTLFDGSMRPFVVGMEVAKTFDGEYHQIPVVQPIEEGTIIRLNCNKTSDKIFLSSQLIFNKIESVETFTFHSGKSAGKSIQIPKCQVDAIHLHSTLGSGETLLVDTGHIRTGSRPMEKKGFQKLPYVGTMVGNNFEQFNQRMLVMLTVREISGKSGQQKN